MEYNKGSIKAAIEEKSVGVLGATWGCQRDSLDVTGEHLHGRKAGKQIKRDELALCGLVLDLWRQFGADVEAREKQVCQSCKDIHIVKYEMTDAKAGSTMCDLL